MKAMILSAEGAALELRERPTPEPAKGEVLIEVTACGVCRTDLHVVDGDLSEPKLPLVPGHEVIGRIAALGTGVENLREGDRAGVPWLGWTCGTCFYCAQGRENLCGKARFTGYTLDGGYASHMVADARFVFPIGGDQDDVAVAPWLCAGLIGHRSLVKAGEAPRLGLYGFGAAAHIVAQEARAQGRTVYAFTRPGDREAQAFADRLGCAWAGGSDEPPPQELDAAIIFAPVGALIPQALKAVRKGGRVVCGGIHMSDIPSFPYELLWGERELVSVANLTRKDGEDFLALAPKVPIETETHPYPLEDANRALDDLREGRFSGAAVLVP